MGFADLGQQIIAQGNSTTASRLAAANLPANWTPGGPQTGVAGEGRGMGPAETQNVNAYMSLPSYERNGVIPIAGSNPLAQLQHAGQVQDQRTSQLQNALGGTGAPGAPGVAGAAVGGGINQAAIPINAGGFGGFFGQNKDYPVYTPGIYGDSSYGGNRQQVNDQMGGINGRPTLQSAGTTIDQAQQAQFRQQQLDLAGALSAQANGQGPSVAGSQLQQSTEQNLQAALAQAASSRGSNLGATQYALGNARANIQQQAAQGLAQTRIQEQMAARSQLGDVLNSGRGADIGLATNQAQLGQQNNQFNTGTAVDQQGEKDQAIQNLMNMGYSLDQANYLSTVQQNQYAVGSLAQQIGAGNGVSIQNANQGIQLAGAGIGAVGNALGGLATSTMKKP